MPKNIFNMTLYKSICKGVKINDLTDLVCTKDADLSEYIKGNEFSDEGTKEKTPGYNTDCVIVYYRRPKPKYTPNERRILAYADYLLQSNDYYKREYGKILKKNPNYGRQLWP